VFNRENIAMHEQLAGSQSIGNALRSRPPASHESGGLTLDILERVVDGIDYGVIVMRGCGNILLTNRLARAELETASRIRIRNNKLAAHAPKNESAIEHALLDAIKGGTRLLQIPTATGTLTLSFAPLNDIRDCSPLPEEIAMPLVLVLIGKHTACSPVTLTGFGQLYGLTRAERRLLPAICQGMSIKEMAKQQRVSVCTVRVHLKSIRDKTGAASLRLLMRQMTTLPPLRALAPF
jgi:DNA-binding CsgD family transcriptional regulator